MTASDVDLQGVVPVLRIFDVEKAKDFYLGFLGFTLDWEYRLDDDAPLYAQVSRSGAVLHLSENHGDGSPGVAVVIGIKGIGDDHRELVAKDYRYYRPSIEDAPWNARFMQIVDPFGNKLRFNEPKYAILRAQRCELVGLVLSATPADDPRMSLPAER